MPEGAAWEECNKRLCSVDEAMVGEGVDDLVIADNALPSEATSRDQNGLGLHRNVNVWSGGEGLRLWRPCPETVAGSARKGACQIPMWYCRPPTLRQFFQVTSRRPSCQ